MRKTLRILSLTLAFAYTVNAGDIPNMREGAPTPTPTPTSNSTEQTTEPTDGNTPSDQSVTLTDVMTGLLESALSLL